MNTTAVELLSPAGDLETLRYAILYGADAIYLGSKEFGMRSSSNNFSNEELKEAVKEAHSVGKRIFLTLNTLPTNEEIDRIPKTVAYASEIGIDALIVADLGVLSIVKEFAPNMEIHFSTQAGITNYASANMAYRLGAKRVVLARELTLNDIASIRKNIPPDLELEVFVHGAMCMSVSGRCLISQYMTGRDANRGQCPQSCRWKYTLHEVNRPNEAYEIGENEEGSYILSADDLCAAPILDKVIQAGVNSLKIEGRSKSFYYVASVTSAYRSILNELSTQSDTTFNLPQFAKDELQKTSHRPYSNGFFLGAAGATQSPNNAGYIREWKVVGVVEKQEKNRIYASQRNKFIVGTEIEALLPTAQVISFTPEQLWDDKNNLITSTPHAKMKFSFLLPENIILPVKTILRQKL